MLPISAALPTSNLAASALAASSRSRQRIALVVSSDSSLRERLRQSLTGLRWQVIEAPGGAEAWMAAQAHSQLEALLVDPWLHDLEVVEFLREFHRDHPHVDLMMTDGGAPQDSPRSTYHQELLYALRRCQDANTVAWNTAPAFEEQEDRADVAKLPALSAPLAARSNAAGVRQAAPRQAAESSAGREIPEERQGQPQAVSITSGQIVPSRRQVAAAERIPELIGESAAMLEVSRRIRLVAGRITPVLIEGPTGSGKELVAEALHRLSNRSRKPFVAINCAAIPEALLEAELFGHTRGAFTGAVQGRTGRIEAADGGTLFLDEIGEMPLALQSKLLRFFESGELQRIGDNETVKVDVRVIAATHQPLAENAQKGHFRADLYYRLAVFLIRTPALAEHMEDLSPLVAHFLEQLGRKAPVKQIDGSAMVRLASHGWPGNVRELEHVLERAAILSGEEPVITASEIDFGHALMN